eukprot:g15023.t1
MSDAGISPAVGIAGHGGMPGMPSIPPAPEYQRADTEDPYPPPRLGMVVVDEVYAKVGAANDVVIVRKPDGSLTVSDFHVMFNRKERVKGGPPDAPSSLFTAKKSVRTYINGKLQPQLYLQVKEDGFCTFPDGRVQPAGDALAALAENGTLVDGVNSVRFQIRYLRDPRVLVAECFAFVWNVNTPMIVVDIDGTITRSDVSGLLMTLTPGLLTDRTHLGICKLLTRMVDEAGAQVVYLTSRPIVLAPKTRAFLMATEQEGKKLPLGPLLCCLEKVRGVLWRELVAKDMHDYKIKALLDLATPFREAGRPFGEGVFAAGIGNRLHDAVAYKAAGIPEDFIFLIDTESNLRVWDGDTSKVGGSNDHSPISPSKSYAEDQQGQQSLTRKTMSPLDSSRKRFAKRLFSSSGSIGSGVGGGDSVSGVGGRHGGGRFRTAAAAAIKEAARKGNFGDDDDDEEEEDDGGGEGILFSPALVQKPGAAASVAKPAPSPLTTMLEETSLASSSTSEAHPQFPASPNDVGVAKDSGGTGVIGEAGEGAAAAAAAAAAGSKGEQGGRNGRPLQQQQQQSAGAAQGRGGSSKLLHSFSSSSSMASSSTAAADSTGYHSYADDRFFDRLRASLDLATWEAQKTVEAAAQATQAGVHAGVQGIQAGVHAGVQGVQAAHAGVHAGVQAGVQAAGSALSGRGVGGTPQQAGEGREGAASRLAERVHEMSARDNPEPPAAALAAPTPADP